MKFFYYFFGMMLFFSCTNNNYTYDPIKSLNNHKKGSEYYTYYLIRGDLKLLDSSIYFLEKSIMTNRQWSSPLLIGQNSFSFQI